MVAPSLITFAAGIGLGVLLASNQPWGWGGWGWNWGSRRAYYNHVAWAGWPRPYRPARIWYRPRPIVWAHRPGYGGNWGYGPPNYRPPRPGNRPGYSRPPYGPSNRPGYRPPGNRPGMPQLGTSKPRPMQPNRPGTSEAARPGNRPSPAAAIGACEAQPTLTAGAAPNKSGEAENAEPSGIAEQAAKYAPLPQIKPASEREVLAPKESATKLIPFGFSGLSSGAYGKTSIVGYPTEYVV